MSSFGLSLKGVNVSKNRNLPEYRQGLEAGKKDECTEFNNPYDPVLEKAKYDAWYDGFCYIRGAGDTMSAS